jgi:hypothetical protein
MWIDMKGFWTRNMTEYERLDRTQGYGGEKGGHRVQYETFLDDDLTASNAMRSSC